MIKKGKILVVYYSRTGNTRKIAQELSRKLNADIDEIKDKKKRGFLGVWLKGSRQAMKGKSSEIIFSKNPENYGLIILGGPVWAWNLIPPLRRYLEENKDKIKKFGFFLTYGGNDGENIKQVSGFKEPIATMKIIDKQVKSGNYETEINEFVKKLK